MIRRGASLGGRWRATSALALLLFACAPSNRDEIFPLAAQPGTTPPTSASVVSTAAPATSIVEIGKPPEVIDAVAVSEEGPPEDLLEAIEADLNAGRMALLDAATHPVRAFGSDLDRWYGGLARSSASELLRELLDEGNAVAAGSRELERITVESAQDLGGTAIVVYCLVSDSIVLRVVDGVVLDDDLLATRWAGSVQLVGGTWQATGGERLSAIESTTCD